MSELNPVLTAAIDGDECCLAIEYVSSNTVPQSLNGESGFHVYHVRMLTELLLTQLAKVSEDYNLTKEDITSISIASSLHDIGKTKIPESILNFPGKLSPIEYDIVKKHSSFGADIIANATGDIDKKVLTYACEIARSHHERYDGTGYPDGLLGDAIPISAQAVSLADAFDALTSVRTYKDSFSQDVAIEMIANGMCGVFNPLLIDCLLRVVNNKVLVEIREQLVKERTIIEGQNIFVPKRVLFAGNTAYVTEKFIEESFYDSDVIILGESELKSRKHLKVYSLKNPPLKALFDTYDFDIIIYFANELTYRSTANSDAEHLKKILECTKEMQKNTRFLYLSSLDGAFVGKSAQALLAKSKEDLCDYYRSEYAIDLKIVRIPYLYLGTNQNDYLYSLFEQIGNKTVKLGAVPEARCYFISMYDVCDLICRFTDNWRSGVGTLTVNDDFNISFGDLADKLATLNSEAKFEFCEDGETKVLTTNNKALRNEYGWFARISILEDLEEQYEKYKDSKTEKAVTIFDKVKAWLKKHTLFAKIAELFLLFIITEVLMALTDSSVYFSIVDFRMAFIVIMATIHGLNFGIAAAGLSSLSWLVAKMISGTKWITIFYEPTNWLSFVFFFLVGAICGYVRLRNDDRAAYQQQQSELIEDKLLFTRELYEDTFEEKRALKKQIISSKDSFGKIFDITRQLDTVEPRQLYLRIMDTFEDILENKSISVYSITENSAFGRLEVASRDIIATASRSISLDSYESIIQKVRSGDVWKNTDLTASYPMYASGVSRNGKLELLIFVWYCTPQQKSLYYVNLFNILCDLVEMSLLRAFDYNQAIYEQQYISGTHILRKEAFEKIYDSFKQMAQRKVFSYVQLEFDSKGRSAKEMHELLHTKVRANDILGEIEDGKLRLLLSQATENDLDFILPRFEQLDIGVTVLDK